MRTSCLLLVLLTAAATLQAQDTTPPTLARVTPAPNTAVRSLTEVEIVFSEAVNGVDAGDLLLNGVAATNVFGGVPGQYVWQFSQPATGAVSIAFIVAHGITDQSPEAKPFGIASWNVTFDPNATVYGVVISEFMAQNDNGIRDEDGDNSDWIELYNAGTEVVNLNGWFLTDDILNPTKWRIPSVSVSPSSYLLVWASEKDRTNPLHTNFKLEKDGEYLALLDPVGNVVSAFAPSYPRQTPDVSYGRDRIDPTLVGFYTNSTPRNNNTVAGTAVLPDVQFSRSSSTFVDPFQLTLSLDNTNGEIRYLVVTDRMSATNVNFLSITNLKPYTGPITIQSSWQVRARAFPKAGRPFFPGNFHTESYIQLNPNVLNFSSDLPLVIIHDFAAGPYDQSGQREETSVIATFEPGYGRSSLTNHPVLVSRAGANARGSSTLGYAKASLAVELWSEFNEDENKPMLGMKAESDWVFYAPNNFEPVLFHNPLYYQLSRDVGRWASDTRYAEVFLNTGNGPVGTNNYNGVYAVEEKIKRSKNRLDISQLDAADTNAPAITGGYIMSIDRVDAGEATFTTAGLTGVAGQPLISYDPSSRDGFNPSGAGTRDPQERYILNYLNAMVTNLASATYTNVPKLYEQQIDVDSWIDHIQIAMMSYNVDAIRLSGFLHKDRDKRIEFGPAWDCDRCMGSTDGRDLQPRTWTGTGDRTDFFNIGGSFGNPWYSRLFRDLDFWQKYVDRYQELRQGAFSLTNIFARIDQNVATLAEAQPREFSRWKVAPRKATANAGGTYTLTTSGATYATEVEWKKEWFTARFNFLDTNHLNRPQLSSSGGSVTNGMLVTLTPAAKAGSYVIYTLDGTDPRAAHGRISSTALSNLGPVTITITENVRVVARSFNPTHSNQTGADKPPLSTPWSGPVAGTFYTSVPPLRITEIMYHPVDPASGNANNQDNFEYLEVKNIGATPLNVNRFRIRGGLDFDLPNEVLAPGEHAVIVKHLAAFRERYGSGPRVLGVYTNDSLANDGDRLILEGGLREPILDFTYDDKWYPITDGRGFSLQIVNDAATTDTWGLKPSWRPSGVLNGTPSAADPGASTIAAIYVNEALTHTDPSPGDAIELYNPTGSPVNIGGWLLTDDFNTPRKFIIPNGTTVPANGYTVFYQSNSFGLDANSFGGTNGFALSSKGEDVYVFSADGLGNLTGWANGYSFGPQANGATFGRHVISTGEELFVTQSTPTLGAANSGPKVGPIVISEINYHPPDIQGLRETFDNDFDEYIELQNISDSSVPLYDPLNPANTWRLRDAVDFTFPAGVVMPARSYVLLVSFDPSNSAALAAFRNNNGVAAGTQIYGPWNGQLDNSSDRIELVQPDLPDPVGTPTAGFVAYILADKVAYEDTLPWPTGLPDGLGAVLARADTRAYGNDPANWRSAPKTPGAPLPTGGIPAAIVVQPVSTSGVEGQSASFSLTATGSALGYIWTFNGKPLSVASSPILALNNLSLDQAGVYLCYVFNTAGSVQSSSVTLTVRKIPRIDLQPVSRAVYIKPDPKAANLPNGTNVTFSVAATSSEPPLSYQWRFNGVAIPGATGGSYTVLDVQLDEEGDYSCAISDGTGTIYSTPARLAPWLQPVIIQKPTDITVAAGSDFTASVEITGNPAPFAYSWRRNLGSVVVNTNSGSYKTNFITLNTVTAQLVLTNNIQSSNFVMRLVVYNDANTAPGVTTTFNVTVLEDSDRDGIPNVIEQGLGMDTNNAADASGDLDLDGMSNRAEFIAGTDPTNSLSYLKIETAVTPGTSSVQFGGISNHTYTVQFTDSLGAGAWSKLADLAARSTNFTVQIPDPTATTNRFYRVATPRQQ